MTNQALDDLKEIARRLGPGLWLSMDEVAIEYCFGYGPAAIEAARAFANERHCAFIYDAETRTIGLSKAYPERGRDV